RRGAPCPPGCMPGSPPRPARPPWPIALRGLICRRLMDVDRLLASRPAFHLDAHGSPFPCEIAEELALLLDSVTSGESRTLETGAGLSTAVFAINESAHPCIVP